MNPNKTLSIVIPVYNEKNTLQEIIRRVLEVDIAPWRKEIIIVDDGSTDGTTEILKSLLDKSEVENSKNRNIVKIFLGKNSGKGTAVKAGLEVATGDYCLIQDADLEYNPKDIPVLLKKLDENKNTEKELVVYGSRNIMPHRHDGDTIPRIGVWFLTKMINVFYSLKLTDVWTCYKLFPKSVSHLFTSGRFESEIAFTIAVAKKGVHIIEAPISYEPRDKKSGKKIKYRDGIKAIWLVLQSLFVA